MILCIDGYNFMHRARSGFQLGDFNVIYNFFRNFKAIVEQMKPSRVYFTLEGSPKRALSLLPEYKANRIVDQTTEAGAAKYKSNEDFHRQKHLIVSLLCEFLPVSVVVHPDFEADDTIFNLCKNASSAIDFVIVSSDSDFIQLLQEFSNVRLYNPVTKLYVEAPQYDYCIWKALRGDASDNIPGIPGVGDKHAEDLMSDPDQLKILLREHGELFTRNIELIRLASWNEEETKFMRSSSPIKNWNAVRAAFDGWGFQSLLKETYWIRFLATFDPLFG